MLIRLADELCCAEPLLRVAEDYFGRAIGTEWESRDAVLIIEIVAQANGKSL